MTARTKPKFGLCGLFLFRDNQTPRHPLKTALWGCERMSENGNKGAYLRGGDSRREYNPLAPCWREAPTLCEALPNFIVWGDAYRRGEKV